MASYALLAANAALSAFTYQKVWLNTATLTSTSVPYLLKSCGTVVSLTSWRQNDIVTAVREMLCIRLSFLRLLYADRTGMAAMMLYGSVLVPFVMRLSYRAATPNNLSALQGALLPSLAVVLTSVDALVLGKGVTLFVPLLISLLYTLGASASASKPTLARLPAATQAVYGANLTVVLMTIFFVGTIMHDDSIAEREYIWEEYLPPQYGSTARYVSNTFTNLFPLTFLPLLWLGMRHVKRARTEEDVKAQLDDYLAAEVAYGFERAWAYYRQAGLLSFLSYLYGAAELYRAVVRERRMPNEAAQYLLLLTGSITLAMLTMLAADQSVKTDDGLDEEAHKAIQRAPAGNPGVEDNPLLLMAMAPITGPSLPLMLWFAHEEEIRGWKGRRAWRIHSSTSNEQTNAVVKK